MENCLPSAAERDIIIGDQRGSDEAMNSVCVRIDREKVIQEIVAVLATLERCNDQEIENVKRFLRWMSDDALLDMKDKYRKVLEKRQGNC